MRKKSVKERWNEEVKPYTLTGHEQEGAHFVNRHPDFKELLLDANSMYIPQVLKRVGLILEHTRSERAARRAVEASLKFRSYHPYGSVCASQHIAYCLEIIADFTRSARSVSASADLIETAHSGARAEGLADRLVEYALDHLPKQYVPSLRITRPARAFNKQARKLFPKHYSISTPAA